MQSVTNWTHVPQPEPFCTLQCEKRQNLNSIRLHWCLWESFRRCLSTKTGCMPVATEARATSTLNSQRRRKKALHKQTNGEELVMRQKHSIQLRRGGGTRKHCLYYPHHDRTEEQSGYTPSVQLHGTQAVASFWENYNDQVNSSTLHDALEGNVCAAWQHDTGLQILVGVSVRSMGRVSPVQLTLTSERSRMTVLLRRTPTQTASRPSVSLSVHDTLCHVARGHFPQRRWEHAPCERTARPRSPCSWYVQSTFEPQFNSKRTS